MTIQASTLRPGLLVSLKTSVDGNVSYVKEDIEREHVTANGVALARWETTRRIDDPQEFERAQQARSKAGNVVRAVCARSAFGLLCPEDQTNALDAAVTEARRIVNEFNATAKLTRVHFYVIAGRVAPDDVEAVRAINSEVRGLLDTMAAGIKNLDAKAVRDAASRAKSIGNMLTPDAQERIKLAIDTARASARKIVAASEQAVQEIDRKAVRKITEQRTAFLDLDDAGEVATPAATARALDLEPAEHVTVPAPRERVRLLDTAFSQE